MNEWNNFFPLCGPNIAKRMLPIIRFYVLFYCTAHKHVLWDSFSWRLWVRTTEKFCFIHRRHCSDNNVMSYYKVTMRSEGGRGSKKAERLRSSSKYAPLGGWNVSILVFYRYPKTQNILHDTAWNLPNEMLLGCKSYDLIYREISEQPLIHLHCIMRRFENGHLLCRADYNIKLSLNLLL